MHLCVERVVISPGPTTPSPHLTPPVQSEPGGGTSSPNAGRIHAGTFEANADSEVEEDKEIIVVKSAIYFSPHVSKLSGLVPVNLHFNSHLGAIRARQQK